MRKILAIFAVLMAMSVILPSALGDSVSSSLTVTNAAPTVGTVTATDPVTLTEGTTTVVWCNATVTDDNGYADVSSASAKLWEPVGTTEAGADDYNNHYTNSSCSLSGGTGTTVNAACKFSVHYSATPAEWTCKITATDGSAATGSANNTAVTINSLIALSTDSSITFPETALGAIATEQTLQVNNTGNSQIDTQLYTYGATDGDGYSMICTIGGSEIPYTNLKYNLTAAQDFTANMSAIGNSSTTYTTETAFNLAAETTDNVASTKDIYWKIQVPSTDVGGSCTGYLVVTAVAG